MLGLGSKSRRRGSDLEFLKRGFICLRQSLTVDNSSYNQLRQLRPVPIAVRECHHCARPGVHLVSSGLLQLTAVRRQRLTTLRRLQSVQNAAARLVTGARRCDHITSSCTGAASPSTSPVQDRGARASVARWSSSRVPR